MCKGHEQVFQGRGEKKGEYKYRKMFNLLKKIESKITLYTHHIDWQ